MAIDADVSTFLSWEQMQAMQLPPNTTMLVPPPPPADVTVPTAPPPEGAPEWLDDSYYAPTPIPVVERIVSPTAGADESAQGRAAAEKEEYGDPALRLMTSLIATNALLERIQTPAPKKSEETKPKKLPPAPNEK